MPQRKFKAHMTSEQFNETLRAIMQIPHKRTKFHTKGQIPHKRTNSTQKDKKAIYYPFHGTDTNTL